MKITSKVIACVSVSLLSVTFLTQGYAEEKVLSDGKTTITLTEIVNEVRAMPANLQEIALSDKRQLSKVIKPVFLDKRLAKAAEEAGYSSNPVVLAKINRARRLALVNAYLDDQFASLREQIPDFSPIAKERYDVDATAYTLPEAIRVAHILFRLEENADSNKEKEVMEKATSVLTALRGGADFSALAMQNSGDEGSAKNGGELPGWLARGKLVQPFEDVAFKLQSGQLSDLVRTRYGFHIIKLLEHQPATKRPYEEVRNMIVERLKTEWLTSEKQKILAKYDVSGELTLPDDLLDFLKKELRR